MGHVNTVIVGAGPAGLATAACLKRRGIDALIVEKADTVGPAWHRHYERLHLHTNKSASGLPFRPMPRTYPQYPSRDQVADYLADYAREEGVEVRLGTEVIRASRVNGGWVTKTSTGSEITSLNLVVATGLSHTPYVPDLAGLGEFKGETLHSSEYRNGKPFEGKRALVVGFGNSAGEIALDLSDHGADTEISIRSKSVVVPRDILRIPILTIARWLSILPPRAADWMSKPLLWLLVGDIAKVGVPKAEWGPLEQIATKGKVPLLDVGTMDALKEGRLSVRPGIERFLPDGVEFNDGSVGEYDVVVFGTGYLPAVDRVLESPADLVDGGGVPLVSGGKTTVPGLYFCGFREPPTGRIREIGLEAQRIASLIAD